MRFKGSGVAVLAVFVGIVLATRIRHVHASTPRFPLWDPAKYGAAGARFADDLQALDPIGFLAHASELSTWPPGLPLLETLPFLVLGPGYAIARDLILWMLPLAAGAAALAGRSIARREPAACFPSRSLLAGAVAAGALLASPAMHLFSALPMIEVPGSLCLLLAVAAYARACRLETRAAWRLAAALATALFFLKFNYGAMWIVPLLVGEHVHDAGGARAVARGVLARIRRIDLRRPVHASTACAAIVIGAVARCDGTAISMGALGDLRISFGNTCYALYAIGWIALLSRARWRGAALAWIRRRGDRARALLAWTALPIAVWMIVPGHLRDFVRFLDNRSTGPASLSLEGLAYYPRVFLEGFSPQPFVGCVAIALALAPFGLWQRATRAQRTLLIALALGALAVLFHPYKQPRFLFPLVPLVWLAAASGFDAALMSASRFLPSIAARGLPAALALVLLALPAWRGVDAVRLDAELQRWSTPASIEPLLDEIVERAAASRGSALVGYWNELSPGLVEWHARQTRRVVATDLPVEPERVARSRDPATILERLAAGAGGVERVLVIDRIAGRDGGRERAFREETGWLDPLRERIASDRRFTLEASTEHVAAGYRLEVFRRSR